MFRTVAQTAALIVVALALGAASVSQAQDYGEPTANQDLFYNYYVPPVPGPYPGAAGAQLYVAPRPVPEFVGHTYYTYQPFLPHEHLSPHERTYVRNNGMAGTTVTKVTWSRSNCLHGVTNKMYYYTGKPARPIFHEGKWAF